MTTKELNVFIGKSIVKLRKSKDYTQQELADYVGKTRVTISYIENGTANTNSLVIWKICNALHCTPNDLYPKTQPAKQKFKIVLKTVMAPTKVKVKKPTL